MHKERRGCAIFLPSGKQKCTSCLSKLNVLTKPSKTKDLIWRKVKEGISGAPKLLVYFICRKNRDSVEVKWHNAVCIYTLDVLETPIFGFGVKLLVWQNKQLENSILRLGKLWRSCSLSKMQSSTALYALFIWSAYVYFISFHLFQSRWHEQIFATVD